MKKILVVTILTFTVSAFAFSQTNDSQTERQLIALSQEFVETSITTMTVEEGGMRRTPFGPMPSLEVKEQWEAVGMKEMKVEIDGDRAIVKGQVVFRGQAPEIKPATVPALSQFTFTSRKSNRNW
jgi:hypothetical protein